MLCHMRSSAPVQGAACACACPCAQAVSAAAAPGLAAALLAKLEAALQQVAWVAQCLRGCQGASEAAVTEPSLPGTGHNY